MHQRVIHTSEILPIASKILRREGLFSTLVGRGFSGDHWKIFDKSGKQWLFKVQSPDLFEKSKSAETAYQLAAEAGVVVPTLVHSRKHSELAGEPFIQIFEWLPGVPASVVIDGGDEKKAGPFLRSLGEVLAKLHSKRLNVFSSRLDGSAPSFDSWAAYVEYRMESLLRKAMAMNAYPEAILDRIRAEVFELAVQVDGDIVPVLCHRDLHPENILVAENGKVVGIIDFDCAEPWDAAADWVKLKTEIFPHLLNGQEAFEGAYFRNQPKPKSWTLRVRLAELMELLSGVSNAILDGTPDYEARLRRRLDALLTTSS